MTYSFLPHTEQTRSEMLSEIGVQSLKELFTNIPQRARISEEGLNFPDGLNEMEVKNRIKHIACRNRTDFSSFLGGGTYNRYIPAAVSSIIGRSEFFTAYTPYQPEASQGTLQAIYDYQSMLCNLTGMDVANASVYDGATACSEAILMAARITKKNKALVSSLVSPDYRQVIETYCYGSGIQIEYLPFLEAKTIISVNLDEYACVLLQNPNYIGCVERLDKISLEVKDSKAKLIICQDIINLALLKPPSEFGADIVVGDLQQLGLGMNFGGPHCGFIACKNDYLRQIPGRIVGLTKDRDGNDAFTLTIQTREQHIKRERATSNICSNQALMALAATVYLACVGLEGLIEVASISAQRARYLAENLSQINGIRVLYNDFLNEFVLKIDSMPAAEFLKKLEDAGILGGINLEEKLLSGSFAERFSEELKNCILIAVTEMNELNRLDEFIQTAQAVLHVKECGSKAYST